MLNNSHVYNQLQLENEFYRQFSVHATSACEIINRLDDVRSSFLRRRQNICSHCSNKPCKMRISASTFRLLFSEALKKIMVGGWERIWI